MCGRCHEIGPDAEACMILIPLGQAQWLHAVWYQHTMVRVLDARSYYDYLCQLQNRYTNFLRRVVSSYDKLMTAKSNSKIVRRKG
jgi:hypothetical protein